MIMQQREREDALVMYNDSAQADRKARNVQQFFNRTQNKFTCAEIHRRAIMKRNEAQQRIQQRRQKLANLFNQEDNYFTYLLRSSIETPAEHRQRLKERLDLIKAEQEREHQEDVERRLHMRWREECDPLRKEISRQFEKQIIAERDQQIIEKDIRRMKEENEDEYWAEQNRKAAIEFRQRHQAEADERRHKMNINKETWNHQIGYHQDNIRRQKQEIEEEGRRFRQQNNEDIQRAREAAIKKQRDQEQRRYELDQINQAQLQRKMRLCDEERKLDEQYLKQAQEDSRKEQEEQMVRRLMALKKARANRELLETQLHRQAESNETAERYLQAVQDEVNQKEDENIRIREEKSKRLMLDTYAYQKTQMAQKEYIKKQEEQQKIREREDMEKRAAFKLQLDREEVEERRLKMQTQARMLERQMELKRRLELREQLQAKKEAEAIIQGYKDEERKIQEELIHPKYGNQIGTRFRGFH